jgi:type IVB pilus formation R64 PilN family outer membrane protein
MIKPYSRLRYLPYLASSAAIAALLAACASQEQTKSLSDASRVVDAQIERTKNREIEIRPRRALTVTNAPWAGNAIVTLDKGKPLPQALQAGDGIYLQVNSPQAIGYIAGRLAASAGIPVRVTDGADRPISPRYASSSSTSGLRTGQTGIPDLAAQTGLATGYQAATPPAPGMAIRYQGPISGALDMICAHFGVSWRYDGQAIILYRYEMKTFVMAAQPGKSSMSDDLSGALSTGSAAGGSSGGAAGGSSGGAAGGSGANQSNKSDATIDYWDDLGKTLGTLVGSDGNFNLSPSNATITVVAAPDTMHRIATFLEKENERLKKQVSITVEIWTINKQKTRDYGVDFNAIFKLQNWPQLGFTGLPSVISGGSSGSFAATVVNPPNTLGGASPNEPSKFNGSAIAFRALNETLGAQRQVTIPFIALNNRPVSKQRVFDQAYLYQVQTTPLGVVASNATGGSTQAGQSVVGTSLTPASVPSGIRMQLLPRILDSGEIMLRYSIAQSQLRQFRSFSSNGTAIQLPDVDRDTDVQEFLMVSGSTLFLTGFVQTDKSSDEQGTLPGVGGLLGGGATESTNGRTVVIAMTPRLVDPARAADVDSVVDAVRTDSGVGPSPEPHPEPHIEPRTGSGRDARDPEEATAPVPPAPSVP